MAVTDDAAALEEAALEEAAVEVARGEVPPRVWYAPLVDALLALRRAERAGSPARVEWWTTTVQVEAGGACAAGQSLVEAVAALAALGEP